MARIGIYLNKKGIIAPIVIAAITVIAMVVAVSLYLSLSHYSLLKIISSYPAANPACRIEATTDSSANIKTYKEAR